MSLEPPVAKGTTNVTGLVGKLSALAKPPKSTEDANSIVAAVVSRFIINVSSLLF
jgi:hypothetical protein